MPQSGPAPCPATAATREAAKRRTDSSRQVLALPVSHHGSATNGYFRYQRITLRLRRPASPCPGTPFGTMIVRTTSTKHLPTFSG
jgi:hypothetical protein